MSPNQRLASLILSGLFGATFLLTAPALSIGFLLQYALISTGLGFAIPAMSKKMGEIFPDQNPAARPYNPAPPRASAWWSPYPIFSSPTYTPRRQPHSIPVATRVERPAPFFTPSRPPRSGVPVATRVERRPAAAPIMPGPGTQTSQGTFVGRTIRRP